MNRKKCEAKTRAGGSCRQVAGWATNHVGEGRCKLHGGKSPGAPAGNKNAVTTGAYEEISFDRLPDTERELYSRIDPSPKVQAEQEIRLLTIRERRMLARIQDLLERSGGCSRRASSGPRAWSRPESESSSSSRGRRSCGGPCLLSGARRRR